MASDYRDRLTRVYDRIHADPAADLSLDELADVAALSRFHFHRVFAAMTGETVAQAVRRIRLNLAAHALVRTNAPVARIARDHGYPDPPSFARAFRAAYGQSPAAFRSAGADLPRRLRHPPEPGERPMFPVTVTEQPARTVVGIIHHGPYDQINAAYARLGPALGSAGLWPQVREMVAVYFDDPDTTRAAELRSLAGVVLAPGIAPPQGLEVHELPGGPHAVMAFRGPYTGLKDAYAWLFGDWLRQSGAEPRDAPAFEIYHNTPMDTAPEDLRTDICVPLA